MCIYTLLAKARYQHTSAYVSLRQHTSAYVSILSSQILAPPRARRCTAYASIRQRMHTLKSAYVSTLSNQIPAPPRARRRTAPARGGAPLSRSPSWPPPPSPSSAFCVSICTFVLVRKYPLPLRLSRSVSLERAYVKASYTSSLRPRKYPLPLRVPRESVLAYW